MDVDKHKDCDDGCGALQNERLRYFTGRHMTAPDFSAEQAYHRSHRHLHNRMLHGWGVVCGLDVHPHPNPRCRTVKVDCGFALDCCGREIPVPQQGAAPEIPRKPTRKAGYDRQQDRECTYWLLCLHYCETAIEPVPVLYNEQACDPQRRESSRIREGYKLEWHCIEEEDLPLYHWKTRGGGCPDPGDGEPCIEDDCNGHNGQKRCCLEPQCPPDHCVPLAIVRVHGDEPVTKHDIETLGRPTLAPPAHALTHICRINWPHGGAISRSELESGLRQLRVRFDRRLQHVGHEQPCGPTGINACTFVVQFGGGYEDLDFVLYAEGKPPHVEHDCVAVFDLDPRSRKGGGYGHHERPYAYLENQTVFITLYCDFVLDCHGVPVDGNHLAGLVPTGDGIAGGTFVSWFRVVPDDEYGRRHKPEGDDYSEPEREQRYDDHDR